MKKIFTLILALHSSLFTLHFANAQYSPQQFRQLEDSILKIMEKNNIPGAQIAITNRDSTLWLGNLGYSDERNSIPVSDQTLFRIGSVTKSFTAIATMMLVEQGILNLDDALGDLAPEVEFENPWEDTDPVTIAHLLEHTTGFDDIHLIEYTTQAEGWSTLEGLAFHPDSRISRYKPGMHSSYCNSGPACVGYVVEKLSNMSYEEFVTKNIFDPLGMENSNYFNSDYTKEHLSIGYKNEDLQEADYWHILDRASGAINSNADEMAKYIRLFLNRGMADTLRLLSEESIERIEHPQTTLAAKSGVREGYGLNIETRNYRGITVSGHGGGMDGYLTIMNYFPDLGIGYICMINNSGVSGLGTINRYIMDFLVPDSIKVDAVDIADTTLVVNPVMLGWYRSALSRAQIAEFAQRIGDVFKLVEKDGKYYRKVMFEEPVRVYPVNDNLLVKNSLSGKFTSYAYVTADGQEFIQVPGYGSNYIKTNGFNIWLTFVIMILCLVIAASSIVAALIWGPISIFGKRKFRYLIARIVPLLAVIFIIGFILPFVLGMSGDMMINLGTLTIYSFSYFLFSILFAVTSLIAFIITMISFRKNMNNLARLHSFILSCCLMIITIYLLYFDMIGLRLWAY